MVVACIGLLLFVGAALGEVAAMVAAHRRAQAAADLAALGAARVLRSGGDACGEAGRLASANLGRLTSCRVSGSDVRVTVDVAGPHWLGPPADLAAESRAGPSP